MNLLAFKHRHLQAELLAADPRLYTLTLFAAALVVNEGWTSHLTVTSVKRLHVEGTPWSPHETSPCRADDVRTLGILTNTQAEWLEAEINRAFDYHPLPPETEPHRCAWYETQSKALAKGRDPNLPRVVSHLHLQVPPWRSGVGVYPCASLFEPMA